MAERTYSADPCDSASLIRDLAAALRSAVLSENQADRDPPAWLRRAESALGNVSRFFAGDGNFLSFPQSQKDVDQAVIRGSLRLSAPAAQRLACIVECAEVGPIAEQLEVMGRLMQAAENITTAEMGLVGCASATECADAACTTYRDAEQEVAVIASLVRGDLERLVARATETLQAFDAVLHGAMESRS